MVSKPAGSASITLSSRTAPGEAAMDSSVNALLPLDNAPERLVSAGTGAYDCAKNTQEGENADEPDRSTPLRATVGRGRADGGDPRAFRGFPPRAGGPPCARRHRALWVRGRGF